MAIPRTRMPDQFARQYFRELRRLLDIMRRQFWQAFQDEIRPRIHEVRAMMQPEADDGHGATFGSLFGANMQGRCRSFSANDSMDEINRILDRLRDSTTGQIFAAPVLERFIRQFVGQINNHTRTTFRRQTARVLGFDPTQNDVWLQGILETAVQENVSWIKSIATQYHDKVETIVLQGARRGKSINDIAAEIADAGDVSLRRGRFIARDQLGSLHGDLTKARHERLGLEKFTWRSSQDERVRDSHAECDGQIFTWKDGARNERGEQVWPGTDYNCRCVPEPLEEELQEIAEEDNDNG